MISEQEIKVLALAVDAVRMSPKAATATFEEIRAQIKKTYTLMTFLFDSESSPQKSA